MNMLKRAAGFQAKRGRRTGSGGHVLPGGDQQEEAQVF